MIDRAEAKILISLVGPGLPVWSLAWRPDGRELLTGGGDRLIRRWNAGTGAPIGPSRCRARPIRSRPTTATAGAEVFRACVACHALTPGGRPARRPDARRHLRPAHRHRAGLSLLGAAEEMDIVWDARTIAQLFEIGPARYTPGTRMPEQTITSAEDREALVRFLERARPR